MDPIRIEIVDDHTLVRKGIKALLSQLPEFEIVAEACNGLEAIQRVRQHQPEIVIMDINMPIMDGLEATRQISEEFPNIKIIILTVSDYDDHLFEAIKAGASGYILKDLEPEDLYVAIRKLKKGEAVVNGILAARILHEFSQKAKHPHVEIQVDSLTERDIEVLQHLVQGENNKQIAQSLSITSNTVKTHLTNIMGKLHTRNRLETALIAVSKGLVDYHIQEE